MAFQLPHTVKYDGVPWDMFLALQFRIAAKEVAQGDTAVAADVAAGRS